MLTRFIHQQKYSNQLPVVSMWFVYDKPRIDRQASAGI